MGIWVVFTSESGLNNLAIISLMPCYIIVHAGFVEEIKKYKDTGFERL